jgi:FHA domain-containing protein
MTVGIRITGCNGIPPSKPLFAEFNERGGNIGRAEGNTLVLHDPMRVISRTHASIGFRNGSYFIRNLGTAIPVYLNGQPLGNGRDAAIATGDEIRIGAYLMEVTESGSHDMSHDDGAAPVSAHGSAAVPNAPKDDPLRLFEDSLQADPFEGRHALFAPSDSFPLSPQNTSARAGGTHDGRSIPASPDFPGIIPPDFDPFGERPMEKPQSPRPASVPPGTPPEDVLDLGLGPSMPNQSIDRLFDLAPEQDHDPFGHGNSLEAGFESFTGHDTRENADPFAPAGASSARSPQMNPVQRDDVPELNAAFRPPKANPDPDMRSAPSAEMKPKAESAASEPIFSWQEGPSVSDSDGIRGAIIPSPGGKQVQMEPPETAPPRAITETPGAEKRAASSIRKFSLPAGDSADQAAHIESTAPDRNELLRAFLSGAGVPDLAIPAGLTPQFMETLGQLLRESTQGTLDLLLARMLTKREVRADLTMIAPRENNPLKFSPSAEAALAHLLSPQGRGFMTPLQAMKDANDDLRSHQFGFMAGMRAALAGVLERFDPVQLEKRITQKTMMDSLLPINRKAKLWDLFSERYREISFEAEEDFHMLFGKEFLRAYEAQIAKLEQDDKSSKNGNS